jgi:hypothetical protein
MTGRSLIDRARKGEHIFPLPEVKFVGIDPPLIAELDGWRQRATLLGGIAPWLTLDEAVAWSGVSKAVLIDEFPSSGKLGPRMRRFHPDDIDALTKGIANGWTPYLAHKQFPRLADRAGLVYFIEAIGAKRVKIGFTSKTTADDRCRELQTASPFGLRLYTALGGSLAVEQYLHIHLGKQRILPTAEWFHLRGEVLQFADYVREKRRWP